MKAQKVGRLLAVLLLIVITMVGCAGRDQKAEAKSRMTKLMLLMMITTEKNKDAYPDMSSPEVVKTAFQPALAFEKTNDGREDWDDTLFIHPSSGQPFVPNANLSNLSLHKIDMPANVIAFYAPEPDGGERLVGYADGRTEWVKEDEWSIKKMAGYAK
jgi:hypothetical protein